MTDVTNLGKLAAAISTKSPAIRKYAMAQAAATVAQEKELEMLRGSGPGVRPAPLPPLPINTVAPAITGALVQGLTLTVSSGAWSDSPSSYAYQWRRCDSSGASCSDITSATSNTYVLQAADVGATLRAVVTASNASGSGAPATSAATNVVAASTGVSKTGYDVTVTPNYETTADIGSHYPSLWMGYYENREVRIDRTVNDEFYAAMLWQPDVTWPTGPNAGETWSNYSGGSGFYGQDVRSYQGQWGRVWNFHNASNEVGGAGWDYSPGNSPLAMDFINGNLSWNLDDNTPNNYMALPWSQVVLGQRYTISIHVIMGRVNGADGTRQGVFECWVDGVKKIELLNINTIWRFTQPQVVIQRYYLMWAGFYTKEMYTGYNVKFKAAYPFLGTSIAAMKLNSTGGEGGYSHYSDVPYGSGDHSQGPASATLLSPSWTSSDLVLPSGW